MSENKQGQEFVHEGKGLVDQLTQPKVLAALRKRHQAVVDAFSDKALVEAKEAEIFASMKELLHADADPDGDEVRELKDQLAALDYGLRRGVHDAEMALYEMDRRPGDYYDATNSPESQALQEYFARPIDPVDFLPFEQFKSLYNEDKPKIRLSGASHEGIMIPTANIISAEGFESWTGRGDQTKDGNKSSEEVIAQYAAMPAESAPGVMVDGVEREDGTIVYIVANGAHRVAAARQRGDAFVKASDITLRKIRV